MSNDTKAAKDTMGMTASSIGADLLQALVQEVTGDGGAA